MLDKFFPQIQLLNVNQNALIINKSFYLIKEEMFYNFGIDEKYEIPKIKNDILSDLLYD